MEPVMPTVLARAAVLAGLLVALAATPARADRIKDLATVEGVRSNQLTGVGLVVGLAGTGDDASSPMVRQMLASAYQGLGVKLDAGAIKAKNVAVVMVTAELPPFARKGQRIDVTVSSSGGAKSLAGGTLIATPLKIEGRAWAVAQGPLAVGGFLVEAGAGTERKNHVTVARVPGGATVEGKVPTRMPEGQVVLLLEQPDFTTATRMAAAIDSNFGEGTATARDAGSVVVEVGDAWAGKVSAFIAELEAIDAAPDGRARVVVDERTGAVVIGGDVRLSSAAIAYGGLSVAIAEGAEVSQPAPLGKGKTAVVPTSEVEVTEAPGELRALPAAASVADVAAALNSLGVKPRDLIAVLQALARAGALHADLEVM
jgi:flagellar P-ring protein FlgI